jgi:7-keto-8-aminopelargonate synthetase-like enzyme
MKPYQVHLFSDEGKIPQTLPSEPVFVYENKRYLNFLVFDCFHLKHSEILRDAAKTALEYGGLVPADDRMQVMDELQESMHEIKKFDSILIGPDEISVLLATFSVFSPQTTFYIDYETSPSISAVLQHRSVEYYSHTDIEHLEQSLSVRKEKVMIVDGVYEWLGAVSPANDLVRVANDNDCLVVGNEFNSFGLLGRDGRGFIDLMNLYDAVHVDIGSFSRFLGGFGCYVGAKRFMINKIKENTAGVLQPLPQFLLAMNCAGLDFVKTRKKKDGMHQTLWRNSRYFITRLKQIGFMTKSDTPIAVISFKNNDEAVEVAKKLFFEQIIVAQNKERLRLCLSIEHTMDDLDYCLEKLEAISKDLGILSE